MTTHYTHLNVEERVTLMIMRLQGSSLRTIATLLGRHPSTLSREVHRQPPRVATTRALQGPGHAR
jgi:IS30 family transposase